MDAALSSGESESEPDAEDSEAEADGEGEGDTTQAAAGAGSPTDSSGTTNAPNPFAQEELVCPVIPRRPTTTTTTTTTTGNGMVNKVAGRLMTVLSWFDDDDQNLK